MTNTVGETIRATFPNGTGRLDVAAVSEARWAKAPWAPTDLFAAVGQLVDRAGIYRRIIPAGCNSDEISEGHNHPNTEGSLRLTTRQIKTWQALGARWKAGDGGGRSGRPGIDSTLEAIDAYWARLWAHAEWLTISKKVEPWWIEAVALMVIADEACADLGYSDHLGQPLHWLESLLREPVLKLKGLEGVDGHFRYESYTSTMCVDADDDVVRVLPKARTPSVGCTLRTLSHNLALVPARGYVDLYWQRISRPSRGEREPLNLLLVPFPFVVPLSCFRPSFAERPLASKGDARPPLRPWGWFHIEQRWLRASGSTPDEAPHGGHEKSPDQIAEFVEQLLAEARLDGSDVHGIILPELALDWATYGILVSRMLAARQDGAGVDFLVCGSSTDWAGLRGNHVLVTVFEDTPEGCRAITFSRAKHHRWALTQSQINGYVLAAKLDPNSLWWEANDIPPHQLSFTAFRANSMFSAMICEDLARIDPCHGPLKAVGPNVVFVLLMDGPQLPDRWSARYATVLADDPGSTVLTLTSLGLIERANESSAHAPSRSVALFKDDSGRTVRIDCPVGRHAVLVTLSGEHASEATLDGRVNADAMAWRYAAHRSIGLTDLRHLEWIIKGPRPR